MKRLFITTNLDSILRMYPQDSGYDMERAKAEEYFIDLPKEFSYDNELKVIVEKDDFKKWIAYTIDEMDDCILYHESSAQEVKDEINRIFVQLKYGSHVSKGFHDKTYQIIFDDDNNKAGRILGALGFTDKQIKEKDELEVKLETLHACLTPEGYDTVLWDNEKVTIKELEKSFTGEIGNKGKAEFDKLKDADDGPFGENYIMALTELRNVLLQDY